MCSSCSYVVIAVVRSDTEPTADINSVSCKLLGKAENGTTVPHHGHDCPWFCIAAPFTALPSSLQLMLWMSAVALRL